MKKVEKKYDVLVVGELNVDLILNDIPSQPQIGKEILAGNMTVALGSSSAIFASNISTLGMRTAFVGKLGNDSFGELVMESLENKKVDTGFILCDEQEKTGATIVLNYGEDRSMITYAGAMEHLTQDDVSDEILQTARHLHVSSVFLQKELKPGLIKLFSRAKDLGMTTSLDVQWDPDEKWDIDFKHLLPFVDVFLPNKQELSAITGRTNLKDTLQSLNKEANTIVVKMSNEGSLGFKEGEIIKAPAFVNLTVVDAIGAGDSFNAGFIAHYINKESLQKCLQYGNLMGAINTTANGGTEAFSSLEAVKAIAKERFNFEMEE